jgi:hypothetical protein
MLDAVEVDGCFGNVNIMMQDFFRVHCLSIKKTDINHIISCQHQYSMTLECQQAQKVISDQYSERFRAHKFRNVVIVSSNA